MSKIKCACGRIVPALSVVMALEMETGLKCSDCNKVIPLKSLQTLKAKPLARRSHPETSAEAARQMQSKLRETQMRALKFVQEHPGKTANELSQIANDRDNRKIGRRLPELAEMGLITRGDPRPCTITRKNATTWNPVSVKSESQ